MKILVVEDEPAIAGIIKKGLQKSGHVVDWVEDGVDAKEKLEVYDYDILILDLMLPEADGFEVCRFVRNLGLDVKIIVLTAKDDVDSKVSVLNMGADDYMTKPFSLNELNARIIALSRRQKMVTATRITHGPISLDPSNRAVLINGKPMKTSLTEYRLLEFMLRHKNQICSRTMLSESVWGNRPHISNVIEATISKLRSKIKKADGNKDLIVTVPKSGYKLSR